MSNAVIVGLLLQLGFTVLQCGSICSRCQHTAKTGLRLHSYKAFSIQAFTFQNAHHQCCPLIVAQNVHIKAKSVG